MGSETQSLHIVMFPFPAHGHMIPALDIARLFAAQNVKSTIITTRGNAHFFNNAIKHGNKIEDSNITVDTIRFPTEVGLPEGCENREQVTEFGMIQRFFQAMEALREQLEEYLEKTRPSCLIADGFFPWATASAAKFDIPRIVFHGTNYFFICTVDNIFQYEPFRNVLSDDELCTLSPFPHEVAYMRTQVPEEFWGDKDNAYRRRMESVMISNVESYGVIVNSFYELETDYADYYREKLGKAWHIGPVSLNNRSYEEKALRGKQASVDEHECLAWLDSKKPSSVVYISFGSTTDFLASQLREIAVALESSRQNFIWVVRNVENGKNEEDWLPAPFGERTEGRGMVIRGWAPQMLILQHEAIGAFVTHCGWNSTLEAISAGVPMVTWPMFADQFYNEKLVTDVLKVGVSVGAKKWSMVPLAEYVIKSDAIEKALAEIMEGEKAEQMRQRVNVLKKKAYNAVAEGGSSRSQLTSLINELRNYRI